MSSKLKKDKNEPLGISWNHDSMNERKLWKSWNHDFTANERKLQKNINKGS